MGFISVWMLGATLLVHIVGSTRITCPSNPYCICRGSLPIELNCNIDGRKIYINVLPNTYINIKCENATALDYEKLPKCAKSDNLFKSVSMKDCPLPTSSFKDIFNTLGVTKTMALIFQNVQNLSGYFERKHFAGLEDLTKLLLSINGLTRLPNNLFVDINKLTWLNIRSYSINLSEELFKPLERLETLEISHNHMTNISSNLFSHLSYLRKLSLWQSNVTWVPKDFFTGVDVLEELDLSSNGLNELPPSIFKPLKKLKKLTLFSNKFFSLPRNLFQGNEELETVIILNNDAVIKQIPKALFSGLKNLKQVYIQRCGLEVLPSDIFNRSPHITNLSLAYNNINALPEAIFNDQINLLELDLSHNGLTFLEPKLFSSLVRLESLDLCYNQLEEISGSTFSSLLSLLHLNMEHNNMKTISSYLFRSNKQRISISLAHNRLDFRGGNNQTDMWEWSKYSPFSYTYNLKLLNLSNNEFATTSRDWFVNGHEVLDISNNVIQYLKSEYDNSSIDLLQRDMSKKPLVKFIAKGNPMKCSCFSMNMFKILDKLKTQVSIDDMGCPMFVPVCLTTKQMVAVLVCIFIGTWLLFFLGVWVIPFLLKLDWYETAKAGAFAVMGKRVNPDTTNNVVVKYCDKDEEFVLKELIPELRSVKNIKIFPLAIQFDGKDKPVEKYLCRIQRNIVLVVFSPNYLTSAYSDINIKKIHGEMLKAKNTVYVFVDIGPDNSIYAFLKEQCDRQTTILWSDHLFLNKISEIVDRKGRKKKHVTFTSDSFKSRSLMSKNQLPGNGSFSKSAQTPKFDAFDTLALSQV